MNKNKRKLNKDHAYMLIVTLIALGAVLFAAYENHGKNELQNSYESEIKILENKTIYLKDEKRHVKINELHRLYENLKEEYNELYQSGQ